VNCIRTFFAKRFDFEGMAWPTFADVECKSALQEEVQASGFSTDLQTDFSEVRGAQGSCFAAAPPQPRRSPAAASHSLAAVVMQALGAALLVGKEGSGGAGPDQDAAAEDGIGGDDDTDDEEDQEEDESAERLDPMPTHEGNAVTMAPDEAEVLPVVPRRPAGPQHNRREEDAVADAVSDTPHGSRVGLPKPLDSRVDPADIGEELEEQEAGKEEQEEEEESDDALEPLSEVNRNYLAHRDAPVGEKEARAATQAQSRSSASRSSSVAPRPAGSASALTPEEIRQRVRASMQRKQHVTTATKSKRNRNKDEGRRERQQAARDDDW
jgi:hypothetical protein